MTADRMAAAYNARADADRHHRQALEHQRNGENKEAAKAFGKEATALRTYARHLRMAADEADSIATKADNASWAVESGEEVCPF